MGAKRDGNCGRAMISTIKKLKSAGNVKFANMVQSVVNSILDIQFNSHPKVNGCVRFLAGFVRHNREFSEDAKNIYRLLVSPFDPSFDSVTGDAVVKLIARMDYAQQHKPEVLDRLEQHL